MAFSISNRDTFEASPLFNPSSCSIVGGGGGGGKDLVGTLGLFLEEVDFS